MKKTLFTGSGVAIVTPFTRDGVDYDKLGELLEWHIGQQTDAIVICGTTGEASTMPDPEHKAVIRYAVEKVAGRIPVIAGTGSNDTRHAIDLSQYAEQAGADGLLVVTPYYNKTTQKGLCQHYRAIAESVHIPILIYNVPGRTNLSVSISTLKELAKIENITAVKEASGNLSYTSEVAAQVPELDIYSGNDDIVVPILSIGGKGVISVAANLIPHDIHTLCQLYFDGKVKEAAAIQLKALDLINKLFIEVNPIPVKVAMNLMGFEVGELRMPLCEMEPNNLDKLKKAMADYGLKLR